MQFLFTMADLRHLLLLASLLAPLVAAHGGLANYTVGDTWYRGYVSKD